jgi:hypothetical protein
MDLLIRAISRPHPLSLGPNGSDHNGLRHRRWSVPEDPIDQLIIARVEHIFVIHVTQGLFVALVVEWRQSIPRNKRLSICHKPVVDVGRAGYFP